MDDMIGNLPRARMSPRLVNGVLKWYSGDTLNCSQASITRRTMFYICVPETPVLLFTIHCLLLLGCMWR